ncbi:hypothetical protein BDK51DRAFT_31680 [Blyttiomyces helicus]|uniref:Uncharacterized protein n=1 Tax=Blyttiomyces helicus TaxID=388810 RepID=A0A4P9W4G5_9FUNG|nr:hypothetical protein BDK51DRAFT_31680 [Blyttiomyces helicus]|eukprot:RKO85748.1 hypothetical protein BDK51DRAFT_31680 [Blyttiomyces helicus]
MSEAAWRFGDGACQDSRFRIPHFLIPRVTTSRRLEGRVRTGNGAEGLRENEPSAEATLRWSKHGDVGTPKGTSGECGTFHPRCVEQVKDDKEPMDSGTNGSGMTTTDGEEGFGLTLWNGPAWDSPNTPRTSQFPPTPSRPPLAAGADRQSTGDATPMYDALVDMATSEVRHDLCAGVRLRKKAHVSPAAWTHSQTNEGPMRLGESTSGKQTTILPSTTIDVRAFGRGGRESESSCGTDREHSPYSYEAQVTTWRKADMDEAKSFAMLTLFFSRG